MQQIREMWPPEVAQRTFVEYLRSQYDHTQLGAIEVRAAAPWLNFVCFCVGNCMPIQHILLCTGQHFLVSIFTTVLAGVVTVAHAMFGRWQHATWAPLRRAAPARRCPSPSSRDLPAQVRCQLTERSMVLALFLTPPPV